MMKMLKMFNGISGNPEMGRILWFVGAVGAIGFQGYALYAGQNFDPLQFAGGYAILLAAGGFGIAQKDRVRAGMTENVNDGSTP